jgi:hypothetical protein
MHDPAVERVGMTHDGRGTSRRGRLHEDRFQAPGRTLKVERLILAQAV